jgi:AraC-like DNA-binding protein
MIRQRLTHKSFEIAVIYGDRLTFAPHSHDEYVLSCNIHGNEKLVLDGKPLEAAQSATTLYNPGQVQSGDGTTCLASIYLDPQYFNIENLTTKDLSYNQPVVNDEALTKAFTGLLGMVFAQSAPEDAEEAVLRVIDCTISRYSQLQMPEPPRLDDWRVERIKQILMDKIAEVVPLEELAREVGLNKVSVVKIFTRATGFPPHTWQRAKRIEEARRLLRAGTSPADTAYQTGFSDQSHLTRWFARAYGINPGEFARRQ